MSDNKQFPDLNSKPNFSEIEKEILDFWDKDETFDKTLNKGQRQNLFFMMALHSLTDYLIMDTF